MARYDFEDATIAHQDYGTGLDPEAAPGPISAAFIAASGTPLTDRVVSGLEPAVDWDDGAYGTLSLSAGVAVLSYDDDDVRVQSEPGGPDSYDRDWHGPIAFPVSVPPVEDLDLEAGENDVYFAIDPSENNAASLVYGTDVDEPDGPHLKRAVVDTDESTVDVSEGDTGTETDAINVSTVEYAVSEVKNEFGETHVDFGFGAPEDE